MFEQNAMTVPLRSFLSRPGCLYRLILYPEQRCLITFFVVHLISVFLQQSYFTAANEDLSPAALACYYSLATV